MKQLSASSTFNHASIARDILTENDPKLRSEMIDQWVSHTTNRHLRKNV